MSTQQARASRRTRSKREIRKSPLVATAVALLAALAIAVAGCGGYSSGSPAPAASASPPPASSAQDKAHGDMNGGHVASDALAAPSSSTGIPQNNGGDQDADNNGGPSDGDGSV